MISRLTTTFRARLHRDLRSSTVIRMLATVVIVILTTGVIPAQAQPITVDMLLARIFSSEDREPYELTANFAGSINLVANGSRLAGTAAGTFREWREAGQPKHWKVTVQRLDLPVLLRPFSGTLQRAIEDRAEAQSDSLGTLRSHDLFILEERPGNRYVLAGIRRDIVDEAIDRYGRPQHKEDAATRQHIARWLYTAPLMREWRVRRGGPYALQAVANEQGLVHDLVLYYNWGQIAMTFAYVTVSGQTVWQEVSSVVTSEVSGVGHVDGHLTLTFSQHRLSQLH